MPSPITIGATTVTPEQVLNAVRATLASGELERAVRVDNKQRLHAALRAAVNPTVEARDEWAKLCQDGHSFTSEADRERSFFLRQRFAGPAPADVHTSATVPNMLVDFAQGDLIAPLACPFVNVSKRADTIASINRRMGKNASFDDTLTPGQPYKQLDWSYATGITYSVRDHGIKVAVTDAQLANQDAAFNVERESGRASQETVLLKHEKRVATRLTTAANYVAANRLTPTTKWDSGDTSLLEPRTDIDAAHNLLRQVTGRIGNMAIVSFPVVQTILTLDDYINRVKYVSESMPKALMGKLADWFNVETVLIGMATEDTANYGATASYADVWPDDVVICRQEGAGDLFSSLAIAPATDVGSVLRWRDPNADVKSSWVGYGLSCDEKIVSNAFGVHIDDVLT